MNSKKNIWLLSAYRSSSHGAWADWLVDTFDIFNWHKLELPGRHFRWRIRGNPLSWLNKLPQQTPDLIVATSMVDLATLKGLHPRLATIPSIYYFHENQFAYPASDQQHTSIDPQMVQLYGALTANTVIFNSRYNQDSFLNGIDQLLKKLPDEQPENLTAQIKQKSQILPVAINPIQLKEKKDPQLILWNHRWEYDKAPHIFAEALLKLDGQNIDFKLALLGERSTNKHPALQTIESKLEHKILVNQKISKKNYRQYLAQSNLVVSSAIHEFQGLAMLEAVSAGAIPIAPNSLCYPQQYANKYLYTPGNSEALANKLQHFLTSASTAPDVSPYFSKNLKPQWKKILLTT